MQPIKKQFENQEHLPFIMNYRQVKVREDELPDHIQDWFELVYIHHGCGTFFIDHKWYEMKQGDVFIIPANTIHRAILEADESITVTAIYFYQNLAFFDHWDEAYHPTHLFHKVKQTGYYRLPLSSIEQETLEQYMAHVQKELINQLFGFKSAAFFTLQLILIMLIRMIQQDYSQHNMQTGSGPEWMKQILRKLDHTDSLQLSAFDLAKSANVSTAHFSRVFKQSTGLNVSSFIMMKRIITAKHLLTTTDDKLIYIAEQCGFDSIPHFYRCFKKMTSYTPAAYRKAYWIPYE